MPDIGNVKPGSQNSATSQLCRKFDCTKSDNHNLQSKNKNPQAKNQAAGYKQDENSYDAELELSERFEGICSGSRRIDQHKQATKTTARHHESRHSANTSWIGRPTASIGENSPDFSCFLTTDVLDQLYHKLVALCDSNQKTREERCCFWLKTVKLPHLSLASCLLTGIWLFVKWSYVFVMCRAAPPRFWKISSSEKTTSCGWLWEDHVAHRDNTWVALFHLLDIFNAVST